MSSSIGLLIALLAFVSPLVVLGNWRLTLPLLCAAELSRIGLIWQTADVVAGQASTTLLIVEGITALSVTLILLTTALSFTREDQGVQLDEFALLELRRAGRRAQQRLQSGSRFAAAIVPLGALVLAGLATWLLSTFYPVAQSQAIDAGWIFLLLCGLLVLITAGDVLKLGLGLLLLVGSAKLLYFGVATRLNVLHVGLLELLTLMLAVIVAYLSGLVFARLRTLDLDGLFERRS